MSDLRSQISEGRVQRSDTFRAPPVITVRGLSRDEIRELSIIALRLGHRSREDLVRKLCRGVVASGRYLLDAPDQDGHSMANQVVSAPVSISTPDSAAQQSTAASTP